MNKIIALALLGISSWTMAATQCVKATTDQLNSSMVPLFQVTVAQPNLTIKPKLQVTYPKTGIRIISPGFKLQSQNCTLNSNGYCVFSVGPTTPKTLQISGTGLLKYTLCVNAECQQQCQNYTANFNGGSSSSNMSYIGVGPNPDPEFTFAPGETIVHNCKLTAKGTFEACNKSATISGGNPWLALNVASKVLYVGTTLPFPQDPPVKLYSCSVKTNGSLGSCKQQ